MKNILFVCTEISKKHVAETIINNEITINLEHIVQSNRQNK